MNNNFEKYVLATININYLNKTLHYTLVLLDENGNQSDVMPFGASLEPKIQKVEVRQIEKTRPTLEEVEINGETYLKKGIEKYFEDEIVTTDEMVDNPNYLNPDASDQEFLDFAKSKIGFTNEKK